MLSILPPLLTILILIFFFAILALYTLRYLSFRDRGGSFPDFLLTLLCGTFTKKWGSVWYNEPSPARKRKGWVDLEGGGGGERRSWYGHGEEGWGKIEKKEKGKGWGWGKGKGRTEREDSYI